MTSYKSAPGHNWQSSSGGPQVLGAGFILGSSSGEDSAIYIGKDGDPFDTLLHEAFEFAMFRAGVTYQRTDYQTEDANARLLIFTHSQFSNLCCQVSRFMVEAGPALNKALDKHGAK